MSDFQKQIDIKVKAKVDKAEVNTFINELARKFNIDLNVPTKSLDEVEKKLRSINGQIGGFTKSLNARNTEFNQLSNTLSKQKEIVDKLGNSYNSLLKNEKISNTGQRILRNFKNAESALNDLNKSYDLFANNISEKNKKILSLNAQKNYLTDLKNILNGSNQSYKLMDGLIVNVNTLERATQNAKLELKELATDGLRLNNINLNQISREMERLYTSIKKVGGESKTSQAHLLSLFQQYNSLASINTSALNKLSDLGFNSVGLINSGVSDAVYSNISNYITSNNGSIYKALSDYNYSQQDFYNEQYKAYNNTNSVSGLPTVIDKASASFYNAKVNAQGFYDATSNGANNIDNNLGGYNNFSAKLDLIASGFRLATNVLNEFMQGLDKLSNNILTSSANSLVTQPINNIANMLTNGFSGASNRYDSISSFASYLQVLGVDSTTSNKLVQDSYSALDGTKVGVGDLLDLTKRYIANKGADNTERAYNLAKAITYAVSGNGGTTSDIEMAVSQLEDWATKGTLTQREVQSLISRIGVASANQIAKNLNIDGVTDFTSLKALIQGQAITSSDLEDYISKITNNTITKDEISALKTTVKSTMPSKMLTDIFSNIASETTTEDDLNNIRKYFTEQKGITLTQFEDALISSTETLQDLVSIYNTTYGTTLANLKNRISAMWVEGVLVPLDEIFKEYTGGTVTENIDKMGRYLRDELAPIIKQWIYDNKESIKGLLDGLKGYDWKGLIEGFLDGIKFIAEKMFLIPNLLSNLLGAKGFAIFSTKGNSIIKVIQGFTSSLIPIANSILTFFVMLRSYNGLAGLSSLGNIGNISAGGIFGSLGNINISKFTSAISQIAAIGLVLLEYKFVIEQLSNMNLKNIKWENIIVIGTIVGGLIFAMTKINQAIDTSNYGYGMSLKSTLVVTSVIAQVGAIGLVLKEYADVFTSLGNVEIKNIGNIVGIFSTVISLFAGLSALTYGNALLLSNNPAMQIGELIGVVVNFANTVSLGLFASAIKKLSESLAILSDINISETSAKAFTEIVKTVNNMFIELSVITGIGAVAGGLLASSGAGAIVGIGVALGSITTSLVELNNANAIGKFASATKNFTEALKVLADTDVTNTDITRFNDIIDLLSNTTKSVVENLNTGWWSSYSTTEVATSVNAITQSLDDMTSLLDKLQGKTYSVADIEKAKENILNIISIYETIGDREEVAERAIINFTNAGEVFNTISSFANNIITSIKDLNTSEFNSAIETIRPLFDANNEGSFINQLSKMVYGISNAFQKEDIDGTRYTDTTVTTKAKTISECLTTILNEYVNIINIIKGFNETFANTDFNVDGGFISSIDKAIDSVNNIYSKISSKLSELVSKTTITSTIGSYGDATTTSKTYSGLQDVANAMDTIKQVMYTLKDTISELNEINLTLNESGTDGYNIGDIIYNIFDKIKLAFTDFSVSSGITESINSVVKSIKTLANEINVAKDTIVNSCGNIRNILLSIPSVINIQITSNIDMMLLRIQTLSNALANLKQQIGTVTTSIPQISTNNTTLATLNNYAMNKTLYRASGGLVNGYEINKPIVSYIPSGADKVPAMLTNGEYVINKKATSILGLDVLNKLNSVTSNNNLFGALINKNNSSVAQTSNKTYNYNQSPSVTFVTDGTMNNGMMEIKANRYLRRFV